MVLPSMVKPSTRKIITEPQNMSEEEEEEKQEEKSKDGILSMLHVGSSGDPDEPARGDDLFQKIKCTWQNNVVRIATMGEGSCFVHSVCKAFVPVYQINNTFGFRSDFVKKLRREFAYSLGEESDRFPGYTYWQTVANGSLARQMMLEIKNPGLMKELGIDYSLVGMQNLLNSYSYLGDEVYQVISDLLEMDIFVVRMTKEDLHVHLTTERFDHPRDVVVIGGNTYHYEVIGIDHGEDVGIQTVFSPDDEFIQNLRLRYEGGDPAHAHFDPDEQFIQDYLGIFTVHGFGQLSNSDYFNELYSNKIITRDEFHQLSPTTVELEYPDISYLPKDDPFRKQYEILKPNIENAFVIFKDVHDREDDERLDSLINEINQRIE